MTPDRNARGRNVTPLGRISRRARPGWRHRPSVDALEHRLLLTAAQVMTLGGGTADTASDGVPGTSPSRTTPPPDPEEGDRASQAQSVSGAFLADGAETAPGYDKPMSYNEIIQGTGDTCAFDAVLSAVARTNFDLASGISTASKKSATDYIYRVRLYQKVGNGFQAVYEPVEFDGSFQDSDVRSTDRNEAWPTLYQRAYIKLERDVNLDYHNAVNAFQALTGVTAFPVGSAHTPIKNQPGFTPATVAQFLKGGNPVVALTLNSPSPYTLDPAEGIIGTHTYTVLGVYVPSSQSTAGAYVLLRNPWGIDTDRSYFDTNHDGVLNDAEYARFAKGLDGNNDGVVRVPWSTFSTYFSMVAGDELLGPSINDARLPLPAPVFKNPRVGSAFVTAGETLGPIDFSATDSFGGAVTYHLGVDDPGSIDPNTGQYTWQPTPWDTGLHTVTVTAQTSYLSAVTQTITVQVGEDVPTILDVKVSPAGVSAAGTDLLTLTAEDVSDFAGPVTGVAFWLDTSRDGSFQVDSDTYLGTATTSNNDNWSWHGYVGGIAPGTYKVFAVAVHSVPWQGGAGVNFHFESEPAVTTISITAAPTYRVAANPVISQEQVSPDSSDDMVGLGTFVDGSGDTRNFWAVSSSTAYAEYMREYDPAGKPLTGPIKLSVALPAAVGSISFAGRPDGSFDEAYIVDSVLKVQRYSASGSAIGGPITVDPNASTGTFSSNSVQAAVDAAGDLLIVYQAGPSAAAWDVYAATVSAAGVATRAPWRVNSNVTGTQRLPTVALNASGVGVIAWQDDAQDAIIGRRVSAAGLSDGAEFTAYHDASVRTASVAAGIDSSGNFTLAYMGVGGIHAIRYAADGTAGTDFKVYTALNDNQYGTRVSEADDGWVIIAWNDGLAGPDGSETVAQIYDAQGQVQGPPFTVPNVPTPTTLSGLSFADDGLVSVEFTQAGVKNPDSLATSFVLYHVALPPIFKQSFSFNVPLGSKAGTVVGTVSAVDPTGAKVQYHILGKSPFAVDYNTGRITVADASALASTSVVKYQVLIDAEDGNPYSNPVTSVTITLTEGPGTWAPIADRVIDQGGKAGVLLSASTPSGLPLTYSASLSGAGTTPATAHLFFSGNTLTVIPAADYLGSFNVTATAADGLVSVSRTFKVTVVVPTLAAVPDQSIASAGSVTLDAADASNAPLTYSAAAVSLNYWLTQTYGLYEDSGGYHANQRGASEKYLRGDSSSQGHASQGVDYWYYILPNGDLYELTPPYTGKVLAGVKVASLGASVYSDPTLLTAAKATAVPVSFSFTNNVLSMAVTAPYSGTFAVITSVNNGINTASRTFQTTAHAPTPTPPPNPTPTPPPNPTPTPTPTPVPPSVQGVVAVTHTRKGLTSITLAFSESLNPASAAAPAHYQFLGAVKKKRKLVYTKRLRVRSVVLGGGARVTITLAKPYKGKVRVILEGNVESVDGVWGGGGYSTIIG